jgi:hypothetical protein
MLDRGELLTSKNHGPFGRKRNIIIPNGPWLYVLSQVLRALPGQAVVGSHPQAVIGGLLARGEHFEITGVSGVS